MMVLSWVYKDSELGAHAKGTWVLWILWLKKIIELCISWWFGELRRCCLNDGCFQ